MTVIIHAATYTKHCQIQQIARARALRWLERDWWEFRLLRGMRGPISIFTFIGSCNWSCLYRVCGVPKCNYMGWWL